jgi:hypothetical protein
MESGTIVAIVPFTGIMAESPWWHDTKAIMVEGDSGVILYGEINPAENLTEGDFVFEGDFLGTVLRVLKKDKGKPVAMLHLECYSPGTKEPVWWNLKDSKPENLLDPTPLIEHVQSRKSTQRTGLPSSRKSTRGRLGRRL